MVPRSLLTHHECLGRKLGRPQRPQGREQVLQISRTARTSISWGALILFRVCFFINLHLKYLVIFCTCNLMFIFDFIFRQKFFKIEFNRIVLHNVLFWTKIMKSIVRIKIVISHYDDSPNIIFEPKNHQNTKYVPICITPNMRFWYSDAISFIKHLESCYSGRLGDISR